MNAERCGLFDQFMAIFGFACCGGGDHAHRVDLHRSRKRFKARKSGQRLLDVYVDSHPDNFAVNRMLPVVAAEGGKLYASTRDVSDNCTVYTIGATTARTTVQQLAKWQNIEFLCDMANTMRNVVGIGSVGGGINNINLTSLSTGKHRFS